MSKTVHDRTTGESGHGLRVCDWYRNQWHWTTFSCYQAVYFIILVAFFTDLAISPWLDVMSGYIIVTGRKGMACS